MPGNFAEFNSRHYGRGFRQDPDARDAGYPLRDRLMAAPPPTRKLALKTWRIGALLNQGATNSCVGHGFAQLLASEPFVQSTTLSPFDIYERAREIDEFPPGTEGTSVRAGARVLQGVGLISNYYWAEGVEDMVQYLLNIGPLVVGTPWLSGMDNVDDRGVIRAVGRNGGGHCYVIYGANVVEELFDLANSWGPRFGRKGCARVSFSDFAKLQRQGGVACAPVEAKAA